jgi:hypothetical protein
VTDLPGDPTERPFEGHFVVGGSGLYVRNECLGGTFTSRTASYELTIGLPQVDARQDPFPPEIRQRIGEPTCTQDGSDSAGVGLRPDK